MAVYGGFEPGSFNAWTLNLFADVFVLPGVARGMQVTAPGGMQVQLTLDGTANDGVCYLPNGAFIRIDTVQTFPVPNNSSGGTRTDAVVAFVDPTGIASPSFSLTYVTNWSSAFSPASPNQLVIALVSVPNGAASIATGNITNNPNGAKLTGTAGSNSMVAADGVGLTVQDNTSSATLSVVLTGLTNGAGRSIAIQTTDISAIGHQSTFDQKGNLILSGSLTTYGRNIFNGLSPLGGLGPSAYDTIVLTPWSTPYSVNIGAADGSFSPAAGIGLYAYDNFGGGFIMKAATRNSITFPVTSLLYGTGWGTNNNVYSFLSWDPVNRINTYWVPQTGSTALGHVFVGWDGTQQRNVFAIGGNFVGVGAYVDNGGNMTAVSYNSPSGPIAGGLALNVGASNAQGTRVARIFDNATSGQNADILDLARTVNQPQTYTFGVDSNAGFYIFDVTGNAYIFTGARGGVHTSNSQGAIPTMRTNGGGNSGVVVWVGTTDPAGNASEGDIWIKA